MITGIRINSVEARRESDDEIKGLDINIGIEAVKVIGPEVEVTFTYTATYQKGVGTLKMGGSILSHEDPAYAQEIAAAWAKDKHLPDAYSELVLNCRQLHLRHQRHARRAPGQPRAPDGSAPHRAEQGRRRHAGRPSASPAPAGRRGRSG